MARPAAKKPDSGNKNTRKPKGKKPRGQKLKGNKLRDAASRVRLLLLDVDGVMTDGSIILDDRGGQYKAFHVRDGHGIKMLVRSGVEVAIITGRTSDAVLHRAKELGINDVIQGSRRKHLDFEALIARKGIPAEETAFLGDDIVDLPVMLRAGLGMAVADADPEVLARAHWVAASAGGRGAVREAVQLILKAKGLWDGIVSGYTEI